MAAWSRAKPTLRARPQKCCSARHIGCVGRSQDCHRCQLRIHVDAAPAILTLAPLRTLLCRRRRCSSAASAARHQACQGGACEPSLRLTRPPRACHVIGGRKGDLQSVDMWGVDGSGHMCTSWQQQRFCRPHSTLTDAIHPSTHLCHPSGTASHSRCCRARRCPPAARQRSRAGGSGGPERNGSGMTRSLCPSPAPSLSPRAAGCPHFTSAPSLLQTTTSSSPTHHFDLVPGEDLQLGQRLALVTLQRRTPATQ